MKEEINNSALKRVDMKLYGVPVEVARAWKNWADVKGLRFSEGMVLAMQILQDYDRFKKLELKIEQNTERIREVFEKGSKSPVVEKSPLTELNNVLGLQKKGIKTFGSKKREEKSGKS